MPMGRFLTINMKDKEVLYASYMPFVAQGGLFIPTNRDYKLGDELSILLGMPDVAEKRPVSGKVVWITPKGAQNNRPAGVGIQFDEQSSIARDLIETQLAGMIGGDKPTYSV